VQQEEYPPSEIKKKMKFKPMKKGGSYQILMPKLK
jgi:hypothetical protein